MSECILEMRNITKVFSGIKALDHVNLRVKRGEIHALCGENGAGKSTLMKVLSGVYPTGDYEGDIVFEDQVCQFKGIKESEKLGIVIIHQELALVPQLSIAENIFLGNEIGTYGVIDVDETIKQTDTLLEKVGLDEQPSTLITNIGVGKQQLVEIAKAIAKNVKILILDEPTAALNESDSENLLQLLLEFKKQGITCIIISHKLNEVMAVSDAVTIIRDGKTIETLYAKNGELSETRIIKGMVGRSLDHRYPEYVPNIGEPYFEVRNWHVFHSTHTDRKILDDINLTIRRGEIVGIAGLMGSGRTELARSIFGKSYGTKITGQLIKAGQEIHLSNVKKAIDEGIAYATEDRKGNGLVLIESITENMSLASLKNCSRGTVIDENEEIKQAELYKDKMRIKSRDVFQEVESLSGGNQQKVVLAKWLLSQPDVLFLDEPTRGIDVGAKYDIYIIIQEMARAGKAVCIISSELPEILGMCDRIYTMNEGRITSETLRGEATQETLMENMTNKVGV